MKIGERLVHFRQQYDLTQDEVVDLLNKEEYKISKSKYCRLETNKSEHTIEFILHFVKILKDKQKVLSDKRDISIFSFLYKGVDDSVNKDNKDLQCINDAFVNIAKMPLVFNKTLFDEIFEPDKPLLKYILGMPNSYLHLEKLEQALYELRKQNEDVKTQNKEIYEECKGNKATIEKYKSGFGYQKLMSSFKQQRNLCRAIGSEFIDSLIKYYIS